MLRTDQGFEGRNQLRLTHDACIPPNHSQQMTAQLDPRKTSLDLILAAINHRPGS
jgi:hypothetical protein